MSIIINFLLLILLILFNTIKSIINFLLLILFNKINYLDEKDFYEDSPYEKKPFKPHYQKYIRPCVKKFEEKRVATLKKLRKNFFYSIPRSIMYGFIITLLAFCYIYIRYNQILNSLELKITFFMCAGMLCFFFLFLILMQIDEYTSSIKIKIFPKIFTFFGNDYIYHARGGEMHAESLEASGIIPYFELEENEDYIKGSYKGVGIRIVEAKLMRKSLSKRRFLRLLLRSKHPITVFKGIFILLDMNKTFSGNTIIKKDGGIIKNWLNDKFNGLENVQLEDRIFEKHFQVYSSDQVEARYILTTSFMERLIELANLLKGSSIQCSFYKKNRILLMIPSILNRFEVSSIFYPATFKDDIKTILSQMDLIFQIIDTLKLNEQTKL
jgi:hypothetical protein